MSYQLHYFELAKEAMLPLFCQVKAKVQRGEGVARDMHAGRHLGGSSDLWKLQAAIPLALVSLISQGFTETEDQTLPPGNSTATQGAPP